MRWAQALARCWIEMIRVAVCHGRMLCLLLEIGAGSLLALPLASADGGAGEAAVTSSALRQPVELGRIDWLRDYDAAVARGREAGKPVMVLFDEVPGCVTCQRFGTGPLSHPIVVDAAQAFVPVAVYNNVPGRDARWLARFQEPAWNNPVVRFVNVDGEDIVPRYADDYSVGGLLARMVEALERSDRAVPTYLRLVRDEYTPRTQASATFAMHCYWVGEQELGSLDGVLASRTGMLDGKEVVTVDFDPTVLHFDTLLGAARRVQCADHVFARTDAQANRARELVGDAVTRTDTTLTPAKVQQYHLAQLPAYHYLPLTALQATKLNAAMKANAPATHAERWLSPSQRSILRKLRALSDGDIPRRLNGLTPDRTPTGLPRYNTQLIARLDAISNR